MFIDIFVVLSFISNLYIWRIFNLFLAIKLNVCLLISFFLDLSWEIHKGISYNQKYEATVKNERFKGLILNAFLMILKLFLMVTYIQLARENHSDDILKIDSEMSINEVEAKDYLMPPGVYDQA